MEFLAQRYKPHFAVFQYFHFIFLEIAIHDLSDVTKNGMTQTKVGKLFDWWNTTGWKMWEGP